MKINDLLMDQVKASFNNRAHINYKVGSNVAPGGKYPLQDLNSATCTTRLVRRFLLEFLEGQYMLIFTGHDPRSKMNGARSLRKRSPTK